MHQEKGGKQIMFNCWQLKKLQLVLLIRLPTTKYRKRVMGNQINEFKIWWR